MRTALLCLLLVGCKFSELAKSGDGGIPDMMGDTSGPDDADIDAVDAPDIDAAIVSGRSYIVSQNEGLYRVSRDTTTGAITLADPNVIAIAGAQQAIKNREDTHLFVSTGAGITELAMAANGVLTETGTVTLTGCPGRKMTIDATGAYLFIGCEAAQFMYARLVNGRLDTTFTPRMVTTPFPAPALAFGQGGCLFTAQPTTTLGNAAVRTYIFRLSPVSVSGVSNSAPDSPANARAVVGHPSIEVFYAIGGGTAAGEIVRIQTNNLCHTSGGLTRTTGADPRSVVLGPTNDTLYVASKQIDIFTIAANGDHTAHAMSPILVGSDVIEHLALAPDTTPHMYLTGPAFGVRAATIEANATLTAQAPLAAGTTPIQFVP